VDKFKTIGLGGMRISFEHVDRLHQASDDDASSIPMTAGNDRPVITHEVQRVTITHTKGDSAVSTSSAPPAKRRNKPRRPWARWSRLDW